MFELNQLAQLLAIKKYQTLSKAAENLNLSQPALSRSIQRLEEDLGVSLFDHQKNKLTFNDDGLLALEYAQKILDLSNEMKNTLIERVKSRQTITIGSIAPAPMWQLSRDISKHYQEMSIKSELKNSLQELDDGLAQGTYQIVITNIPSSDNDTVCIKYCQENLCITLSPTHPLAHKKELSLSDLNGQNILLYTKIGFWLDICKTKMPKSKFLMQDEIEVLDELRKSSTLPCFATNITSNTKANQNRVIIPLTDKEVNVTFYLKYKLANQDMFKNIKSLN